MKIKGIKIEPGYFIQKRVKALKSAYVTIQDQKVSIIGADGSCENITNGKDTYIIDSKCQKDVNYEDLKTIIDRLDEFGLNMELEMIMDSTYKWWIVQVKYKK